MLAHLNPKEETIDLEEEKNNLVRLLSSEDFNVFKEALGKIVISNNDIAPLYINMLLVADSLRLKALINYDLLKKGCSSLIKLRETSIFFEENLERLEKEYLETH